MKKRKIRKIKRRQFLEGLTAAGVVVAAAPLFSCGGEVGVGLPIGSGGPTVYRFQTLKSDRCNACSQHQHYKVFLDPATADANRAHPGCNCRIVAQQVSSSYFENIVLYEVGGMIDLRFV